LGLGSQKGLLSYKVLPKGYPNLEFPTVVRLIGLGTLAVLGVWAAMHRGDDKLNIPWVATRKAWLGAALFIPLGALWLVSLYNPIYLVGRYDFVAFPAFALLLGFALAKLQAVRKVGPLLVLLVGMALFVPIGLKLVLYYQAPVSTAPWVSGRQTAQVIDAVAQNGDVVLFTGLRGATTLYYLVRLGYQWQEGYCRSPASSNKERRFACRIFPFEIETYYMGVNHSSEPIQVVAMKLLAQREDATNALWIAVDAGSILGDGRPLFSPRDAALVAELERGGLRLVSVSNVVPGIFEFR